MFHVDSFSCALTEKGRSPGIEEAAEKLTHAEQSLLVLVSVEKEDEEAPESIVKLAAEEIKKLSEKLRNYSVVIHPFAHLFGEMASADRALQILKDLETGLRQQGLDVLRTPFGWFHTMEIKAKGHPLSRVARLIRAPEEGGSL